MLTMLSAYKRIERLLYVCVYVCVCVCVRGVCACACGVCACARVWEYFYKVHEKKSFI